jgi:hypothetical protein
LLTLPGEKRKFMSEANILSQDAIDQLLSLTDERVHGPTHEEIVIQLQTASLASLFVLSRKAHSTEVQREAATILNARLHEGDTSDPECSPFDAVSQGELPPSLATHRHFLKFSEGERWVLTTRSGIRVATFPNEAELDRWWLRLKRQRGRILTRVSPKKNL